MQRILKEHPTQVKIIVGVATVLGLIALTIFVACYRATHDGQRPFKFIEYDDANSQVKIKSVGQERNHQDRQNVSNQQYRPHEQNRLSGLQKHNEQVGKGNEQNQAATIDDYMLGFRTWGIACAVLVVSFQTIMAVWIGIWLLVEHAKQRMSSRDIA